MPKSVLAAAALVVIAASSAAAHVTLERRQAPVGSYYKAVFAVPHGCAGSPTVKIRVQVPEGVIGIKPMPKAGWNVDVVEGQYASAVESHGKAITSAVREISWKGGPLPDAWYDEFVMQVKLPDEPGKLYFRVVQQCGKTGVAWDEIPGDANVKLKAPAPVLEVLPASAPAHQH